MNVSRLLLYFNTVKYLKGKQFVFNFIRRLLGKPKFVDAKDVSCKKLNLLQPVKYINKIDSTSVCFLNETRSFNYISDWVCADEPKLWRYNLHYFDFLLDDGASEVIKDKLIDDWIKVSRGLREDAWEPYPVSLRLVNWIKYFIIYKNNSIPDSWLQSLYQQAHVLNNSIEYHILANHYLKNGKALFFAGAYLDCADSDRWYLKGKHILLQEADEQILDDGGHYEKSPMYHSIIVEDYLDVINLLQENSLNITNKELSFLKNTASKALVFFDSLVMTDGGIPLFNDSAFNIAPSPEKLFECANEVTGYTRKNDLTVNSIIALKDSGYFSIRDGQSMCVIDCGSVSPNYQPGHTHCDLLSYELVIDGQRCIVNSGLHDYDNSEERRYCRSTRAHNTIEIDGKEQTEIWGQFRVARRATVLSASLDKNQDGGCVFKGEYSPYWSGKDNIIHSRIVKYKSKQWIFSDEVTGKGIHTINNFIHLSHDIDCIEEESEYFLKKDGEKLAKISFSDSVIACLEDGWYYPEFGKKLKSKTFCLSTRGVLPINQSYVIQVL